MRQIALVIVLSLVAVSLLPAPQARPGPDLDLQAAPECKPSTNLENDHVRIWFHGKKGFVKVFASNNTSGEQVGMYQYKTGRIEETNASGLAAWMNLERAFPHTSTCTIEDSEDWLNMTLVVTDTVRSGSGGDVGDATVTFAYHFNKTGQGAKFDLHVDSWPWQAADSELSYTFDVATENLTIEDAPNGVGFRDSTGTPRGYIEWADNATARYADEHEETALVVSNVTNDGSHADVTLAFTNVTAGYETLVYDPWVGAGPYIIIPGVRLIGLAGLVEALPDELRRLADSL